MASRLTQSDFSSVEHDRPESGGGPDELFVELFAKSNRPVFSWILTLVGKESVAEEIYQETCLALWRSFSEYDRSRDFTRWACGVALNQVRQYRRRVSRDSLLFDDETVTRIAASQQGYRELIDLRREALATCLERLPREDQSLVKECYQSDSTIKAGAERLGRPISSVYKALTRIQTTLFLCVDRILRLEDHHE
ncbi:sigma-70 family RNA polymerase sigma factor [Stratiformator vulcanicus]|uniref:RNA polymerase sigma factor n=1 Tax=Stratiformator vulcanicus TaxID=2527980 RepID=A0A517R5F2_9PLAN|nr:sigma-70 family RNA polymerase sigma factor [Stratiformator vulcanicus]QDT39127.1 RNA polymerase sigma factor [Stratiformator vulcanicus]